MHYEKDVVVKQNLARDLKESERKKEKASNLKQQYDITRVDGTSIEFGGSIWLEKS